MPGSVSPVYLDDVENLTLTPLRTIPLIRPGDELAGILLSAMNNSGLELLDGDILVLAQKIVSKAEGRSVDLNSIVPSSKALEIARLAEKDPRLVELILRESREVLRVRPGTVIVEHRLGFVCANAGIDHSNVLGELDKVLLLPQDPDASACKIRQQLELVSSAKIGVLIIDSHGRAWRLGTVGVTIGISGLPGLVDLRGVPDLFGFKLQITQVGVADELAAAGSLVMGQASEGTPAVHVRGFPYAAREARLNELLRPHELDMFR
jgi:coenzyme F420-0:L-glutamate ligase / coenzyme F420-1:gamma-L-glutamate ligase